MSQKRSFPAWVLLVSLLTVLPSPHIALAAPGFAAVELVEYTEQGLESVPAGSEVDRGVQTLQVRFNQGLDAGRAAEGAVTLTDSSGQSAAFSLSTASDGLYLTIRSSLKANEQYTLRVADAGEGPAAADGDQLTQPAVFTFRTNGRGVTNTLAVGAMDEEFHPFQTSTFRVTAGAGPLMLRGYAQSDEVFHVMVKDLATDEIILNEILIREAPEAVVELSQASDYEVAVTRMEPDGMTGHGNIFTMTGPELAAHDLEVPALQLLPVAPYEVLNEPFDTQAAVLAGMPAQYLRLELDGAVLRENILRADGSAERVVIDPAELAEGIHMLVAQSQSPGSANRAAVVRQFFVDLEDSFTDVTREHWARKPVEAMKNEGILDGRGNGEFDPEDSVTREEFAKMLALTLGVEAESDSVQFADIPQGHWSAPYVTALAEQGWIRGEVVDGVSYFAPDRTISRAEAATIIGRTLGIENADVPAGMQAFTDDSAIPSWARPSVLLLADGGWITGFPEGHFAPAGTLTRAQAARILSRYVGL